MCLARTSVFSEGAQAQTPKGPPVVPPNQGCHLPSDLKKVSKSHYLLAFLQNTQKPHRTPDLVSCTQFQIQFPLALPRRTPTET